MIKGTAKRIIVVKSPDPKIFEEAIFIVREDYMRSKGITQAQLLADARRAANGYAGGIRSDRKPKSHIGLIITLSTVFGSSLAYVILKFIGI